jgi:hypothetical protein
MSFRHNSHPNDTDQNKVRQILSTHIQYQISPKSAEYSFKMKYMEEQIGIISPKCVHIIDIAFPDVDSALTMINLSEQYFHNKNFIVG